MKRVLGSLGSAILLVLLLAAWLPSANAADQLQEGVGNSTGGSGQMDTGVAVAEPVISVWYGTTQEFGQLGNPQKQINILGNVQGATRLHYSLNGGPDVEIARGGSTSVGAQLSEEKLWHPGGLRDEIENLDLYGPSGLTVIGSRRLVSPGDFNIEIETDDLLEGPNTVEIKANLDGAIKRVTVNYAAGNTWQLPYTVDWSSVTDITDVAQIVDGEWELEADGIRPTVLGYDRVVAVGDIVWKDFDVLVPITIHRFPVENVGGVGVAARWQGHFQVDQEQPGAGWWELGAYGLYRNRLEDKSQLWMYTGHYDIAQDPSGFQMDLGKPYFFRMRVQTKSPGQSGFYSMRVWEVGQPEPSGWTFQVQDAPPEELMNGSVLLVAHEVDATFGDVVIRPVLDLNVSTAGSGAVKVTPDLEGESDAYLYGDTVKLTAAAEPGWAFVGWSGSLSGSENPATLTLTEDAEVQAVFGLERRLDVDVEGGGRVRQDPVGPTYGEGAVVRLTPLPDVTWTFKGWSGDDRSDLLDNGDGTWLLVIDGDKAVTAVFAQPRVLLPLVTRSR